MDNSFSNQNRNRDYPLLYGTSGTLPYWALLDAHFTYPRRDVYDNTLGEVKLEAISSVSGVLKFKFGLYLPYNPSAPIYITVDYPANPQPYSYVSVSSANAEIDANGNSEVIAHSVFGFVAFSRSENPAEQLTPMTVDAWLEPTCVAAVPGAGIFACSVGNANRTRATAPVGCPDDEAESALNWGDMDPQHAYWKQPYDATADDESRIISGEPIILREGLNCTLNFNSQTNTITITPRLGGGMSVDTYRTSGSGVDLKQGIPLGYYTDANGTMIYEHPPVGRTRYDGAVNPEETIRRITNTPGQTVLLVANRGITIKSEPQIHTVLISAAGVKDTGC